VDNLGNLLLDRGITILPGAINKYQSYSATIILNIIIVSHHAGSIGYDGIHSIKTIDKKTLSYKEVNVPVTLGVYSRPIHMVPVEQLVLEEQEPVLPAGRITHRISSPGAGGVYG
jgi:hypothetical protein